MKTMNRNRLLGEIKLKQNEMYSKAKSYGYTDPRVVFCSQDLDTLLNKYQGINQKKGSGV
ncbi:stage 0 sporulation regulatory protein [Evansella caseinilytica]|uniref:Stage 0 sporulation regulatory protein n=1 Tax=Evansella caseinilytica TaxID=1503961 RepID=A0A1H3IRW3_9BACI|nr:aspartyl-phosphate phosphatase Spo0E family protein [Evansella caseinilytica]SDY30452.1 stage 0 sporulation regulatory protein [Evansella caseinilytica]